VQRDDVVGNLGDPIIHRPTPPSARRTDHGPAPRACDQAR
jgi:hypothetical protein